VWLGISGATALRATTLQPGADGVRGVVKLKRGEPTPFAFDVTFAGSNTLWFAPSAAHSSIEVSSPWLTPGFEGSALPISRELGASGFNAHWNFLTPLPQGFGVRFVSPADTYRSTDRAVKYELLFLGLTFLAFMLYELLGGLRVHPVQYLLVGLALCLFFLLLLSLSEQLGFGRAYAIAGAAVVSLVTLYVRAVLQRGSRALSVGALLTGLYGFLYVLLQIEDYALLTGSVALFGVLAAVMWFTRRVDWYQLRTTPPPPELSL
jgi:inner membrane protein